MPKPSKSKKGKSKKPPPPPPSSSSDAESSDSTTSGPTRTRRGPGVMTREHKTSSNNVHQGALQQLKDQALDDLE